MPPVQPQNIEACDRLKSDDNGRGNKVIVKFSKRKDMAREMNKKKIFEKCYFRWYRSRTSLFINRSFRSCYEYFRTKCKAPWSSKLRFSLWVSNGSLRIKLGENKVK